MKRKTAVIVGATSGIGLGIASILAEKGWKVGVAARRTDRLEAFVRQWGGDNAVCESIDITLPDAPRKLLGLIDRVGGMDLFVNVAGIGKQNPQLAIETETETIRTNAAGFTAMVVTAFNYFTSHAEEGGFDRSHPAHLAIVSSVAGTKGIGVAPSYSATKKMQQTYIQALVQLSRSRRLPIVFSDIRPGFVRTDLLNPSKHYPLMISSQKAARLIVHGLEKRRRVITVDWKFRIITFLWKLIPSPLWERLTIIRN